MVIGGAWNLCAPVVLSTPVRPCPLAACVSLRVDHSPLHDAHACLRRTCP